MKITRISTVNLKGLTETFALEPLNLLIGKNGSGKTARLLALRYAIAGTTPFGARPEDAFKLSSGPLMRVSVVLDDGYTWTRAITRDPMNGSLKSQLKIVGRDGLGLREAAAAIAEKVGTFAPMFDLGGAFLGLSADKSRDYVLDLCAEAAGGEGCDPAALHRELLIEFYKSELGPVTVDLHLARGDDLDGLKDRLGADMAGYLNEVLQAVTAGFTQNPAESLAEALRTARTLKNSAKQNRDRAHQAAQELSERKQACEVTAGSAADLEDRYLTLAEHREEIVKQLENQAGREHARVALRRAIEAVTARLADAQRQKDAALKAPQPDPAEADKLETEAAAIVIEEGRVDPGPLIAGVAEVRKAASDAATEKMLLSGKVVASAAAVRAAESSLKRAQDSPWQKASVMCEHLEDWADENHKDRPMMWHELFLLVHNQADLDNIPGLEAAITRTKDAGKLLDRHVAELTTDVDKAEDFLATAEDALRSAEATNRESERLCNENTRKRDALLTRSGQLRDAHRQNEVLLTRADAIIKECGAEKVDAERRLNDLDAKGGHINVDDLYAQRDTVEVAIAKATTDLEGKRSYAVLDTELTACIVQAERETVLHDLSKSMCDAIRALRERLMERMVAPLLDGMNKFLEVAAPGRKAYCDLAGATGKTAFELGWVVSNGATVDTKVPLPALSGGETALYGAGLAFAMVSLAKVPLKLLLLEAGEVDADNLKKIMKAISVVGGGLSNVMIATHVDPEWLDPDWNIVKL